MPEIWSPFFLLGVLLEKIWSSSSVRQEYFKVRERSAMEQYLPEITPLLIGLPAFAIGLVFALRERAWRHRRAFLRRHQRDH